MRDEGFYPILYSLAVSAMEYNKTSYYICIGLCWKCITAVGLNCKFSFLSSYSSSSHSSSSKFMVQSYPILHWRCAFSAGVACHKCTMKYVVAVQKLVILAEGLCCLSSVSTG